MLHITIVAITKSTNMSLDIVRLLSSRYKILVPGKTGKCDFDHGCAGLRIVIASGGVGLIRFVGTFKRRLIRCVCGPGYWGVWLSL